MTAQKESEETMKAYAKIAKIAMTVMLLAAFFLLSGFRAQTIIHDDGSETQDVLKVSDSAQGQKSLKDDADEFQKRNYTIKDYNNKVQMFPSSIVASVFHFEKRDMFVVEDSAQREAVKVEF